jgi:hypothetical protein
MVEKIESKEGESFWVGAKKSSANLNGRGLSLQKIWRGRRREREMALGYSAPKQPLVSNLVSSFFQQAQFNHTLHTSHIPHFTPPCCRIVVDSFSIATQFISRFCQIFLQCLVGNYPFLCIANQTTNQPQPKPRRSTASFGVESSDRFGAESSG